MANNIEPERRPRNLEGLKFFQGKKVYLELRGDPPLVSGRNEIALVGKIVDSREFQGEDSSVTIEIPLSQLASLSLNPITSEQRDRIDNSKKE